MAIAFISDLHLEPIENTRLKTFFINLMFSSTEEGNIISFEDQKRKLELVIQASNKIWGE